MPYDVRTQVTNDNAAVLANAVELGSRVIVDIAGNEISDAIGGRTITLSQVQNALAARLKASMASSTGG